MKQHYYNNGMIAVVRKEALASYVAKTLKADENRVYSGFNHYHRGNSSVWLPVKNSALIKHIKDEDIVFCTNEQEAKDMLEAKVRNNLSEEEASILAPSSIEADSFRVPYDFNDWHKKEDKVFLKSSKELLSKTIVSQVERDDAFTWQICVDSDLSISVHAPTNLVLDTLKKGKVLQINFREGDQIFGPCQGSYYPETPGVCAYGSKVFYDLKKWKSRKNYWDRVRLRSNTKSKVKFIPRTVPSSDISQIYFQLLDSFMTTGVKRLDKLRDRSGAQRWNANNPLEELIQVWSKRYQYKLVSKFDYFRRIHKILLVLKTHGSLEKRAAAVRTKSFIKLMKEIYPIVQKMNFKRIKIQKGYTTTQVEKQYGQDGYLFFRYYTMFLVKAYGFKEPKGKRK